MALNNFIPTVWSETLYEELDKQYIAVSNCNREFEGDIREKGDRVRICGVGDVSVSDYVKNSNMADPEVLDADTRDLIIDQAKYFNFQIDDIDRAQSSPRLMELAMKRAASALANEADTYIYNLYSQSRFYSPATDPTVDTIIYKLIDARGMLLRNNVCNSSDIVFEVSPEVASLILKAKVTLTSDTNEKLEAGCIGSIGGSKIYVSNNVCRLDTGSSICHQCYVRTKRAIAFAEQLSEIDAYRPEHRFADAVKGLHLYGAKVIYPKEFVVMSVAFSYPHEEEEEPEEEV